MNFKFLLPALLISLSLVSCKHAGKQSETKDIALAEIPLSLQEQRASDGEKQQIPTGKSKRFSADTATQSPLPPSPNIDWDKKIVKNATVQLEVKDFKKTNEAIHATARKFGGYIAQEEQQHTSEKYLATLSIKVPVEQFEVMLGELSAGEVKVLEKKITSQDVTGEVVDTKSRLEAKRQARLKYLDFLKASKNMEDLLRVQDEINSIQEEIEAAAGRIDYLVHQAAYSTVNLSFYQVVTGFQPVDINPSFFTRIGHAFKLGAGWIADILVALVSIWPLVLITAGVVFVIKTWRVSPRPQKS